MLTTTEERKMAGKLSENGMSEKSLTTEYYPLENCLPKTRTKKTKKCTHMLFGATQFILKKPHIVIAFIEGLKGFVKIR